MFAGSLSTLARHLVCVVFQRTLSPANEYFRRTKIYAMFGLFELEDLEVGRPFKHTG